MLKKFLFIYLLILFSLNNIFCKNETPYESQGFFMGTIISERIYGANGEKAGKEIMNKISQLEDLLTINKAGGDINRLNSMSGKEFVKLNNETIYVLETALKFSKITNGAFDVTVGPLVKAWGVFTDNPRIPTNDEIKRLLNLVNNNDLIINSVDKCAKLNRKGQIVDLGGIAKGYAGDVAIQILKNNKITSAYVNLGGNVVVLGKKPDGSLWNIAVQNPRSDNGRYIGILQVEDTAIVTSGDYQRFFEKDGVRYHHIIDPKTGYPSDSGLISVTIVTKKSIEADALSKIFVLGLEKGMNLIKSLSGVEAIFITKEKNVYITSGLKNIFKFEDESKEFKFKGVY